MKNISIILLIVFFCGVAKANNIQITNISVVPANNTIKFNISWENSWRSSVLKNWDAAYVFFKYYDPTFNGGAWRSVHLGGNNDLAPANFTISGTNFPLNKGVFIYRSANGSGTATVTNVEVGVPANIASGIYDVKAYAIEMVYIPAANFFVGDNSSKNGYTLKEMDGNEVYNTIFDPLSGGDITPAVNFPNGTQPFYCMKYELSQGGYRDFLNSLTYAQQIPHIVPIPNAAAGTAALYNAERNSIKIKTPGNAANAIPAVFGCDANTNGNFDEAADGEYVACNFLNWVDHAAYLDWAGLRPITEWEFEKAARGILLPVAGEFIWGNTNIHNATGTAFYSFTNLNQPSEAISNLSATPIGNAYYYNSYSTMGPVRNGIFATTTSNRVSSGGGYYGVMELGGNLWERVITTANSQGRNLSLEIGDGDLTITPSGSGYGYSPTWPGARTAGGLGSVIDGVINATGLIYRGGCWDCTAEQLRTSDRSGSLVTNQNIIRSANVGIRGGISAP